MSMHAVSLSPAVIGHQSSDTFMPRGQTADINNVSSVHTTSPFKRAASCPIAKLDPSACMTSAYCTVDWMQYKARSI